MYQIVRTAEILELIEQVNEEMKKGWNPIGAPFLASPMAMGIPTTRTAYAQAMVKAKGQKKNG